MVVESHIPGSPCWHCRTVLDAAAGSRTPTVGDVTLCTFCAEWNVFGDGLQLRRPTDEEAYQFDHTFAYAAVRRYLQERLIQRLFEGRDGG